MARIGSAPYKINPSFTEVRPGVWQGDYDYGKTSAPAASTATSTATTTAPRQLTSPQQTQLAAVASALKPVTSVAPPTQTPATTPTTSVYGRQLTSSLNNRLQSANTVTELNAVLNEIHSANQQRQFSSTEYESLLALYRTRQTALAATAANSYEWIKAQIPNIKTESEANKFLAAAKAASDKGTISYSQYRNIETLVNAKIRNLKLQAPNIYNDILDKMNAFAAAKSLSGLQGLITEVNSHKAKGVLSDYQASSLIRQIQEKITSLKIGDPAIFNKLVQLIQNAKSITALASILNQINAQYSAGNINDSQLKQLQSLYTAKYKELQTQSKEADDLASQQQRFESFLRSLQQATNLTQLASIKAQIESARSGGLISSSQYAQLLSLYTSMQSQLEQQKQAASRFNEFYAIIQNATSTSALTYLPSQLQAAVSEGTLSTNEYTSLISLLQQKIAQLQQKEEEEEPPTVEVDLPTATQIYSAPDLQVLSNYESQIDRAVRLSAIDQTKYIVLANAISSRRSQLLQEQRAETTPTPAAAAPSQTIVTIAPQAPLPSYQQPTAPTIVQTAPSVISAPSPAPIIYSPPSQGVSPVGSGAPAAAPDWSFMTPAEGPPLPRSLGIRWPWYTQPEAA